jgi:hypothetical protein
VIVVRHTNVSNPTILGAMVSMNNVVLGKSTLVVMWWWFHGRERARIETSQENKWKKDET